MATKRGSRQAGVQLQAPGQEYVFREPVAVLTNLRGSPGQHPRRGSVLGEFNGSRVVGSAWLRIGGCPGKSKDIAWLKVTGNTWTKAQAAYSATSESSSASTPRAVSLPTASAAPPTVAVNYSTNYVFWAPKTP